MRFEQVKNDLKAAMSAQAPKTSGYDTRAEVVRVADGKAWVHIPGGVDETPVALTIDAKEGDQVQVRVAGGSAWLVGNASAPPTDDRTAIAAGEKAEDARVIAVNASESAELAKSAAESAVESAATAATAAGEAKQSATNAADYASRALGNLSTVQSVAETLAWITQHGTMTLTSDTEPDPTHVYFIRDNNGDYEVGSYRYSIVAEPVAADMGSYYELSIDASLNNYIGTHLAVTGEGLWVLPAASNSYKVLVATGNGTQYTSAGTYIIDSNDAVVAFFGSTGLEVYHGITQIAHLGYGLGNAKSGTANAPYYVLGLLPVGASFGNYSLSAGIGSVSSGFSSASLGEEVTASGESSFAAGAGSSASGYYSAAIGEMCEATAEAAFASGVDTGATGKYSHAQNRGTLARSDAQTAIGKYNIEDANDTYGFIIGNGTSNTPSNAFTVAWSGDVEAAGDITDGSGNTLSNKVDSSTLDDLFISKSYSASGSINANTGKNITANDLSISTPAGYTPVGVVNWATGHTSVMCRGMAVTATGSSVFAYLRNIVGNAVNYSFSVRILYIKSRFYTAQ